MQIHFADDTLCSLCASHDALERRFGKLRTSVKLCLGILASADSFADVVTFTALTVKRIREGIEGVVEFLISHAAIQLRVRALGISADWQSADDRELLKHIKAVSVLQVTRAKAKASA